MKNKAILLFLFFGVVIVILDISLTGVVITERAKIVQSISDFVIVMLASIVGFMLAQQTGLPILWRFKGENKKKEILLLSLVSIGIIAINSFVNIVAYIGDKSRLFKSQPPLELLDPKTSILYSLRSALTDELIFRFLMITLLVFLLQYFVKNEKYRIYISILMASFLYALIHPIFFIPLVVGTLLSFIYINHGLVPVLVIHFLANFIPFMYIAMSK